MNNKLKDFIECKSYELGLKVIIEEWDTIFGWKKIDMTLHEYFEKYEDDEEYRIITIWSI